MLLCFPSPYPDELLYSVCSRYHERSLNACLKATMKDLFGSKSAIAVIDLPSRLDCLSSKLASNTINIPEKLIHEHTLLPLYRPFLPQDRVETILMYMKGSGKGGRIHLTIGAMASGIPTIRFLRYCQECLKADVSTFGEPYWHRSHQISGVMVCHRHRISLDEHDQLLVADRNKHLFQPIPEQISQNQRSHQTQPLGSHPVRIAQNVAWLLNNRSIPVLGLQQLYERYLNSLKRHDLASFSGRVAQRELIQAFIAFYGHDYLEEAFSALNNHSDHTWLSYLVRPPRGKATHPIRHLLLIRFLGLEPEEFFFGNVSQIAPFGIGPWPCLNPAADHFRGNTIAVCQIAKSYKTESPIGSFYCQCGFNYSRTGPDICTDDIFRRDRVLDFGSAWEAEFQRLVSTQASLRAIARRLGVDAKTVKRHLNSPAKKVKAQIDEALTCWHRNNWIGLVSRYSSLSRKSLRALAQAEYSWLYRHDREWLLVHPQSREEEKPTTLRVNWPARDRKIAEEVTAAATAIRRQLGRPVRLTLSSIGKKLGLLALIQKNVDKLPRVRAALDQVVEDDATYRFRRVQHAIRSIRKTGEALQAWRVARKAGLKKGKWFHDNLVQEILLAVDSRCEIDLS